MLSAGVGQKVSLLLGYEGKKDRYGPAFMSLKGTVGIIINMIILGKRKSLGVNMDT